MQLNQKKIVAGVNYILTTEKLKTGSLSLQKRLADGTTAQNVISTETTSSTWKKHRKRKN